MSVLSGVDRASFAIGLTDRLRRRGASATTGDAAVFAAALERSPLEEPLDVYWVGRLCLVHRACEIPMRRSAMSPLRAIFKRSYCGWPGAGSR